MSRLRWRTVAMSIVDVAGVDAVVGRAAGQVRDAPAGDHGLGGSAALVDAGAADMLSLDQGGLAPGPRQRPRQRPARLPGADDDRVVVRNHCASSVRALRGCAASRR